MKAYHVLPFTAVYWVVMIVILSNPAFCQQNTLSISNGTGATGSIHNIVSVSLDHSVHVAGIYAKLFYPSDKLHLCDVFTANRTQDHFEVDWHVRTAGELQFSLVDYDGNTLAPGAGPIVEIDFEVKVTASIELVPINILQAEIADSLYQSHDLNIINGKFQITKGKALPVPYQLIGEMINGQVALNWQAPHSDQVSESWDNPAQILLTQSTTPQRYNIYRSQSPEAVYSGEKVTTIDAANTSCRVAPREQLYYYQVTAVYADGESYPSNEIYLLFTAIHPELPSSTVVEFRLHTNYPNPFNSQTVIVYDIPKTEPVILKVYNLLGACVNVLVDEIKLKGNYSVSWDGLDKSRHQLPSGIYFYVLQAGSNYSVQKMVKIQ